MNRPLLGRIVGFVVVFYLVALAGLCAYVFFSFSANEFLPAFRIEVTVKEGFGLFMRYLFPVHAAAVAVAASLAGTGDPARGRKETPPFVRLLSSSMVAFLLLTAAYTFVAEVAAPRTAARVDDLRYISRVARSYQAEANRTYAAGDYAAALDAMDRYLVLDPENKEFQDNRFYVAAQMATKNLDKKAPVTIPSIDPEASAQALYEQAQAAAAAKDWFTAHYFAQAAAAADPRRRDAQQLAARAWDELTALTAVDDKALADLAKQKKDAYALLDSNPVAAYYSFKNLAARYPQDKDIATYAKTAADRVAKSTFFVDEAQKLAPLPGIQGLLFFNRRTAASSEVVSIGKMVADNLGNAWFFDVEAVSYDAAGRVAWHLSAPYGVRLAGAGSGQSVVLMRAIARDDPSVQYMPVYLQGGRPAAERDTLVLTPTMEELRTMSAGGASLDAVNIAALLRLRGDLGSLGLPRPAINVALAMKLVMPFVYLTLSMFGVALGWGFRARPGRRLPFLGIIMLPVIPVVCGILTLLYVHAHRVVAGFTVLAFGLPTALVALAALQAVLLAVGLVLLAGQSTR